jgi:hypothetical protein
VEGTGVADGVGPSDLLRGTVEALHDTRFPHHAVVVIGAAARQRGMEDALLADVNADGDGVAVCAAVPHQRAAELPGGVVVELVEVRFGSGHRRLLSSAAPPA